MRNQSMHDKHWEKRSYSNQQCYLSYCCHKHQKNYSDLVAAQQEHCIQEPCAMKVASTVLK